MSTQLRIVFCGVPTPQRLPARGPTHFVAFGPISPAELRRLKIDPDTFM
ncbi:hypothetical protein PF003_g35107 [Phytophthora fragariae]|nr:hypothetical protein PF003_g35107 [Phytophthora fragariae]